MTDAEFHQQELEHQQLLEELKEIKAAMNRNHGKMIGIARFIRDSSNNEEYVERGIKELLVVLQEYEDLNKRMK